MAKVIIIVINMRQMKVIDNIRSFNYNCYECKHYKQDYTSCWLFTKLCWPKGIGMNFAQNKHRPYCNEYANENNR